MIFKASIDVMPHKELLDPPGKAVAGNMHHVYIRGVDTVRIGKHIEMVREASDKEEVMEKVGLACRKLLANVIMETYTNEMEPEEQS